MLCSGCQWALQFTPTRKSQRTAFTTTLQRIQRCSEVERCFLCTAIYRAAHDRSSAFERILQYTQLVEDLGQEETPEFVLIYSAEIGSRPHYSEYMTEKDVILVIRWRLPWFPKNTFMAGPDGSVAELKFFFSPMTKDQGPDESVGIDIKTNESTTLSFNITYRRHLRNKKCPECHTENLPEEAFRAFDDDEQAEVVDTENHEEDDDNTTLRDGFRFDFEVDRDVASDHTGSSQTWNQVQRWMKTCNDEHDKCPKMSLNGEDATVPYPTRLLDLQPVEALYGPVRLTTTQNEKPTGRYMTLSHCWGAEAVLKLTSENFEDFSKGIAFEDLNKTFQDAVVITRKIGIRHLWIDSLCIIQEGPESRRDWHVESAIMDQVYRGSFLNIGATGAADGRHGCFRDRDYLDVFRPAIWKSECVVHYQQFRQKYRLVERSFLDDWLLNEPLLQRGWVYQERFLAPRMLHFGSRQLFWECRKTTVCESFPTHLLPPITMMTLNHLAVSRQAGSFGGKDLIKHLGHIQWHRVVEEYSSKSLTRPEDKLVAISGVARRYWEVVLVSEDEYWAGVWSSDLPHGLFWTVRDGPGHRPDTWRAPTWSWASIDGVINVIPARYFQGKKKDRQLAIADSPHLEYVMKSNPFGTVTAAAWKWKTRLIRVEANLTEGEDKWRLSHNGRLIEESQWIPDEPTEGPVVALLCFCIVSGEKGMEGLTVTRVEGEDDEYVRTGLFQLWSEKDAKDERKKNEVDPGETEASLEEWSKEGNNRAKGGENEGKRENEENQQLEATNDKQEGEGEMTDDKEGKTRDEDEGKIWFRPPPPFEDLWELGVEMGNDNHSAALGESLEDEEVFWLV